MGEVGYQGRPNTVSAVVAAACGYECIALLSGRRLPTLSQLQRRHEPLAWLLVGWLVYHLRHYEEAEREMVAEDAAVRAVAKARLLGLLPRPVR